MKSPTPARAFSALGTGNPTLIVVGDFNLKAKPDLAIVYSTLVTVANGSIVAGARAEALINHLDGTFGSLVLPSVGGPLLTSLLLGNGVGTFNAGPTNSAASARASPPTFTSSVVTISNNGNTRAVTFNGDKVAAADFAGDGKLDLADAVPSLQVFNAATGALAGSIPSVGVGKFVGNLVAPGPFTSAAIQSAPGGITLAPVPQRSAAGQRARTGVAPCKGRLKIPRSAGSITSVSERMVARSTALQSSRRLPGQLYSAMARCAASEKVSCSGRRPRRGRGCRPRPPALCPANRRPRR